MKIDIKISNLEKYFINIIIMYVVKRNGYRQQISFDKVTKRITNLVNEQNIIDVEVHKVSQATISQMYNGMTTKEIDELSAKICASFAADNPEYSKLAESYGIKGLTCNHTDDLLETIEQLQSEGKNVKVTILPSTITRKRKQLL